MKKWRSSPVRSSPEMSVSPDCADYGRGRPVYPLDNHSALPQEFVYDFVGSEYSGGPKMYTRQEKLQSAIFNIISVRLSSFAFEDFLCRPVATDFLASERQLFGRLAQVVRADNLHHKTGMTSSSGCSYFI